MSFIEHQREHIAMQWFLDQTEAAKQVLEDIQVVTASGSILQEPLLYLARLGDLTRSNSFLWIETLCKTLEHYSRVLQMCQERSREFVLSTLAVDILVGYLTLNSRRQMFPYLVQAA